MTAAAQRSAALVSRDPFTHPGRTLSFRSRRQAVIDAAAGPAAVQFAASVPYGTIVSFITVLARDRDLQAVGTFFALLALSSLGVRMLAGKTYDVWGAAPVLIPAFAALAAGMALLTLDGPAHPCRRPAAFLLAAVLAGAGIGGAHTTLMARVADRSSSESRASSMAGFNVCWELGVGAGAILMGQVAEAGGLGAMFMSGAALPLVGLASLPWLRRRGRQGLLGT